MSPIRDIRDHHGQIAVPMRDDTPFGYMIGLLSPGGLLIPGVYAEMTTDTILAAGARFNEVQQVSPDQDWYAFLGIVP
jgi:hypothetical protein